MYPGICPGASKQVTSEPSPAGSVLQFAGLEVALPSGVAAVQQGSQCLTLRLSDGASITLRAGAAGQVDHCAADGAAPVVSNVQQPQHSSGDAGAPPPFLACSEQLTNGTIDSASRCAPVRSQGATARQQAPPKDFRSCFALMKHTGDELAADDAAHAGTADRAHAEQPTAEQPSAVPPAADSFDVLLQQQSQRAQLPAAAPSFRPGRFLLPGETSGPPSGAPSGSAAPSATAEQSVTAEIDSPCAPASPANERAAVQSAAVAGGAAPGKLDAVAAAELPTAKDVGLASTARRRPPSNDAAAPTAPSGPRPLQAAAASACVPAAVQPVTPPPGTAASTEPSQAQQPLQQAAPGDDAALQQAAAVQRDGAVAPQQHRAPLAAVQTPQAAPASSPGAAAGSGRKRKSTTLASAGRPRAARTRRSSVATPGMLAAPEAPDAGTWRASWQPVYVAGGAQPAGRWGASLLATGASEVCLVGGAAEGGPIGDAWQLQLSSDSGGDLSGAWQLQLPLDSGRCWHTASRIDAPQQGSGMLVFGGEVDGPLPDELDTTNDTLLLAGRSAISWDSLPLSGEGEVPKRAGHTATWLPDGRVLIFGGVDGDGRFRNDAFLVDVRRCRWLALAGGITRGAPPKPRAYHSATLVGDRIIFVGGLGSCTWSCKEVYSLSIDEWVWREHTSAVDGDVPSPRYGHTAAALGDGHSVVMHGGGDAEAGRLEADLAVLDTATWRWSRPALQEPEHPPPRTGHCLAMLPGADGSPPRLLLAMGRCPGDTMRSDAWVLNMWEAGCG